MTHPLRLFVNSRTPMVVRRSVHPISVLYESVASYLCYLMLTCTHSNDATHSFRYTVVIDRPLAEGGFAVVFEAHDPRSGEKYALKKILAMDAEARQVPNCRVQLLHRVWLCGLSFASKFACCLLSMSCVENAHASTHAHPDRVWNGALPQRESQPSPPSRCFPTGD